MDGSLNAVLGSYLVGRQDFVAPCSFERVDELFSVFVQFRGVKGLEGHLVLVLPDVFDKCRWRTFGC